MNCDKLGIEEGQKPWTGGGLIFDDDEYRRTVITSHASYYGSAKPKFCGEVGACQRRPGYGDHPYPDAPLKNRDLPDALTAGAGHQQEAAADRKVEWRFRKCVSTFHYTVWAALLSGGAAAPLAWCDGKNFGEMQEPGGGNVRFSAARYQIDYMRELEVCRLVIDTLGLEEKLPLMVPLGLKSCSNDRLYAMVMVRESENPHALVWLCRKQHAHGTATEATDITLSDARRDWDGGQWADAKVVIVSDPGVGQVRTITANTATQITIATPWATVPAAHTSRYSITFPIGPVNVKQLLGETWAADEAKVAWLNPWTGVQFAIEPNQALSSVPAKLGDVDFSRPCAGEGNGRGPHEREDVILWITPVQ